MKKTRMPKSNIVILPNAAKVNKATLVTAYNDLKADRAKLVAYAEKCVATINNGCGCNETVAELNKENEELLNQILKATEEHKSMMLSIQNYKKERKSFALTLEAKNDIIATWAADYKALKLALKESQKKECKCQPNWFVRTWAKIKARFVK